MIHTEAAQQREILTDRYDRLDLSHRDLEAIPSVEIRCDSQTRFLVSPGGDSLGLERFRLIAHRLALLRSSRDPIQKVLVTSAVPGEGKTTVAINLASALAGKGSRVVVVNADLRKPPTNGKTPLPAAPGLADVLEERERLAGALRRLTPLGIHYLPAGAPGCQVAELLQSRRLSPALASLCGAFDWVILDSPPANLYADSALLATAADATLIVVRTGATERTEFEEALATLRGVFVAGVVMNEFVEQRARYYYAPGYATRRGDGA